MKGKQNTLLSIRQSKDKQEVFFINCVFTPIQNNGVIDSSELDHFDRSTEVRSFVFTRWLPIHDTSIGVKWMVSFGLIFLFRPTKAETKTVGNDNENPTSESRKVTTIQVII